MAVAALAGLAASVIPQIQSYFSEDAQSKLGRKTWRRTKPVSEELYSQLVYAPWMEGQQFPFSKKGDDPYSWNPSTAMGQVYSNALSRAYGMPSGIARAFSTQAMANLRNPGLVSAMTPGQVGQQLKFDPAKVSESMLAQQQIGMANQRSLMSNAQRLADMNAWRAGKIGELIG